MPISSRHPDAVAVLTGKASGTIRFWQLRAAVLIEARIRDLPDGFYAFHIHENAAGGHYNPDDLPHPRHAGDLPSLLSCGGEAYLAVKTCRFRLGEILGRTAVIHAEPDDFRTQPSGNPGEKIAQGIILPASAKIRTFSRPGA